ncbi:MAG: hypothetical protein LBT27_04195 [Prevotellaceae bacterium]|jgi:uncharacterized ion transporter superfamily protein YfcC|nr:hypothetical protein [Prevotellaceae bacterium]
MEKFLVILIPVAVILLLCVAAMSVKIWIKKDGKFAETEIGKNKNMQKLGIKCVKQEELERLNKNTKQKVDCTNCEGCFLKEK